MEESPVITVKSADDLVDDRIGFKNVGCDRENLLLVQPADEEVLSRAAVNDKAKKIKTTDSKEVEEISVYEESEEDCSTPWARALKTDLILQRIFRYLPTGVLLSRCSFINKFWNAKARSFIWTYRKCTPKSKRYVRNTCEYLQEIQEQCRQITSHGRSVPFNNLILMSSNVDDRYECHENPSNNERAINFGGELKIKYLMAFGRDIVSQCPVHQPFSTVLQSGSIGGELRILQIHKVLTCGAVLDRIGWEVMFPKLQKFVMFHVNIYGVSQIERQAMKDIVEKLLQRSPSLGEIYCSRSNILEIVPKERYRLVKKLDFRLRKNVDMELLRQIAKLCYGIQDLEITETPFKTKVRRRNLGDDEPVNAELRRQFEITVEQMLETCKENLKMLRIVGAVPLALCSSVTLVNLTSFTFKNGNNGKVPPLWDTLASIDYTKMMPNLQKMEITIRTLIWSSAERSYVAGKESHIEWPEESYSNEANGCFSARKLKLNVDVEKVNLNLVWWLAPNVRKLVVRCSHTWATWGHLPSISEICELWPCLEQLKISGDKNCLKRNCDAEFCGITEEEADLLREKDEDFLQAVHIVPIQPCLSTMKYLRILEVDLKFSGRACRSRSCRSLTFISKVTELVVLKRMSDKDFRISGTLDAVETDGGEGDNDGNGQEDCNCHDDDEEQSNANNEDDADGESDASVDDGEGESDDYESETEGESDASIDEEEGYSDSDANEGGDSDDVDVPEHQDRESEEGDGNAEQSD